MAKIVFIVVGWRFAYPTYRIAGPVSAAPPGAIKALHPAVAILKPHHVILFEVRTRAHFDQIEWNFSGFSRQWVAPSGM